MKRIALKMLDWYQAATRNTAHTCRYHPSCSNYAKDAYQTRNFFVASALTAWRLLRCNPFTKGGHDPVPPPKSQKGMTQNETLSDTAAPSE